MSQEIEYSEKYADDEFEYRCSAPPASLAPAPALWRLMHALRMSHTNSHASSLRRRAQSRHLAQAHCQECTQGAAAD